MSHDDHNDRELDALLGGGSGDAVPENVERQLRQRLENFRERIEGSGPGPVSRWLGAGPVHDRMKGIWLSVACLACTVIIVLTFLHVTRPLSWADVVESIQKQQWIRCHGARQDGAEMEFWFSSSKEHHALATRFGGGEFVSFVDFDRGERLTYRRRDGEIVRRPPRSPSGPDLGLAGSFLSTLAPHDELIRHLNEDSRLVDQSREEVTRDGERWIQYRFVFEEMHGERERFVDTYLIDTKTDLPRRWIRSSPDGKTSLQFEIEYPDTGPYDIFDLGVPESAPIVAPATEVGVAPEARTRVSPSHQ